MSVSLKFFNTMTTFYIVGIGAEMPLIKTKQGNGKFAAKLLVFPVRQARLQDQIYVVAGTKNIINPKVCLLSCTYIYYHYYCYYGS